MSDIDFDTAKLLMDVIESAARHGARATNIAGEAANALAEIEAEAYNNAQDRAKERAAEEAERAAAQPRVIAPASEDDEEEVQPTGRRM